MGEHNAYQHEVVVDKLHAEVVTQYTEVAVAMAAECKLASQQFFLHILAFQLSQFCPQSFPKSQFFRQFSP